MRVVRFVRGSVGIAALVAGAIGTFACDAILGEETRYFAPEEAGKAADAMPAVRADAAAATRDASPGDAAAIDGGGGDDGGDDGDGATEADAGPFCASGPPHFICSDFDEGDLYFDYSNAGAQWTEDIYGVGVSALAPAVAPESLPAVFFSDYTGPDGGTTSTASAAALQLALPTDVTQLQLDFDLLAPVQTSAQGTVNLISLLQPDTSGNGYGTWIHATSDGLELANFVAVNGGTQSTTRALPALPPASWTHVRLAMTRAAAGHITVSFGGSAVVDQDLATLSADTQHFVLVVGLNASASTSVLQASYDNVTLDITE